MGITAHWIDVKDAVRTLDVAAIGFKGVVRNHTGFRLAKYFYAVCNRVGIFEKKKKVLYFIFLLHSFS